MEKFQELLNQVGDKMSMTDPLADMLSRIRNAVAMRKMQVQIPFSKMKEKVARILLEEGYLDSVNIEMQDKNQSLVLGLRYLERNQNAIEKILRCSKPGQRKYLNKDNIPKIRSGLGISILSTSKGILSDKEARQLGIGGELLCEVW